MPVIIYSIERLASHLAIFSPKPSSWTDPRLQNSPQRCASARELAQRRCTAHSPGASPWTVIAQNFSYKDMKSKDINRRTNPSARLLRNRRAHFDNGASSDEPDRAKNFNLTVRSHYFTH